MYVNAILPGVAWGWEDLYRKRKDCVALGAGACEIVMGTAGLELVVNTLYVGLCVSRGWVKAE